MITRQVDEGVCSVEQQTWHAHSEAECLAGLETSLDGLSQVEVDRRRELHGLNLLHDGNKVSLLTVFFNQFRDFMTLVLIAATLISGLLGEYTDAITIVAIVFLNGILGFVQEVRAERSLKALKELTAPVAKVRRGGAVVEVSAKELVPGDIVLLEDGDRVPADGRIVRARSLEVEESALTGESVPVMKDPRVRVAADSPLADRRNMVYMGTMVTRGRAEYAVTAIGMQTEMGKIADLIDQSEDQETPLQKRLDQLGKTLVWISLGITVLVVVAGVMHGHALYEMFLAGVSLAVAAIPEGLPAIVTIALALGVQRMIKRNAIVRRLPSVETLGCATVICSDKTGTLTQNKMTVTQMYADGLYVDVTGSGHQLHGEFVANGRRIEPGRRAALKSLVEIAAVCNQAHLEAGADGATAQTVKGDPTEIALLVLAHKAGFARPDSVYERVDERPFDADRKMMSVLVRSGEDWFSFVKGAPDVLLERCTHVLLGNREEPLGQTLRKEIASANDQMASRALRNLGFAYRRFRSSEEARQSDWESELVFVGICGMIDPPRDEAKSAIAKAKSAGIRTVMITGDHQATATAIAKQLDILPPGGRVLTGADLERVDDKRLSNLVRDTYVYARVTPEHKLRIVRALQANHEVVAMTGDGVNDAPAIKQADIGIAMGQSGTDVAKEASSLILADDNYATIVAAVEEGRAIYDNIKKFIRYLLASNVGEILTMFLAMLAGWPLPLTPIQILWVNLVTDGLPAIALGVDAPEDDIMSRPPRNVHEGIFARGMAVKILSRGVLIGLATLAVFAWSLHQGAELAHAQTMAYATLTMAQLILVFDSRSLEGGILRRNPLENIWLLLAVLSSVALFACTMYVPRMAEVFHTTPLGLGDWAMVLVAAAVPSFALSVRRMGRNRLHKFQQRSGSDAAA
nr:calcium-translocating P-type ATPase, SERCA-type [Alicyclobacillus mali (ex Roth et al. 2021)]